LAGARDRVKGVDVRKQKEQRAAVASRNKEYKNHGPSWIGEYYKSRKTPKSEKQSYKPASKKGGRKP